MRERSVILMVCMLVACSTEPPKPPMPVGEYHPVNKPIVPSTQAAGPHRIDLTFAGDIQGALLAIHDVAPELSVAPSVGKSVPIAVNLNLRGATIEEALTSLGQQGCDAAEVVLTVSAKQLSEQAYIRFRPAAQAATTSSGKHVGCNVLAVAP